MHLVSKTHCSAQNLDQGRRRPTTGCAGTCAQKLDWLVVEEITQLDIALWAEWD